MATLQIPDEVYEELAERARINERSITDEVIAELSANPEEVRRREYQKLLDRIRALPPVLPAGAPDPVDVIREIRDHDGRS